MKKNFLFLMAIWCLKIYGQNSIIDCKNLAARYFQNDAPWYLYNVPFFECSDKNIQDVYYYRWQLYKAHICRVGGEYDYVISEFINNVWWARPPFSTINCASGHHIYEGRWLKDKKYVDGYIRYLNEGGGNDRQYSENIADATYSRYLVNADSAFVVAQLPMMKRTYENWSIDHFDREKKMYYIQPSFDGTEWSVASIDASGSKDGFWGGFAFRPTINSYMYGNAVAISKVAALKGDVGTSNGYRENANALRNNMLDNLWDDSSAHFLDRYQVSTEYVRKGDFIRSKELAGYIPWQYNLPDHSPKYLKSWKYLLDTTEFLGKYGVRTVGPSYEYYLRPTAMWNGLSWPYQTAQALAGMANLLNNYPQNVVIPSDYLRLLRLYTQQHKMPDGRFNLVERYNADTGEPIGDNHYNHSCYNDLIITGLCGLRPSEGNTLVLHPLIDASVSYFCLSDVLYHGHLLTVVYDADGSRYKLGKGMTVFVDGKKVPVKENSGKYEVEIGSTVVKQMPEQPVDFALNIRGEGYPKPSASVNATPDSLYKAVDGRIWYFPEVANRWTTYGSAATSDWYSIDFGKPRVVSSLKLYWYIDGKMYHLPDGFSVVYKNKEQWLPVRTKLRDPVKPIGNAVNTIEFDAVKTTQIRVDIAHRIKGSVVAIAELECY